MANQLATAEAVSEHYATYPYPPLQIIEQEDCRRNLRHSFNYELGLVGEHAVQSQDRMWIPGCGTRWAVMAALQFSDIEILATDLSAKSIELQKRLANDLGIDNISFKVGNFLETNYSGEFKYISCVGVLHHLPNPREGFECLARSLGPKGIVEIMVYDFINRAYSIRMQKLLKAFGLGAKHSAEERYQFALRLITSLTKHAAVPKEYHKLIQYLKDNPNFNNELADFISNPNENYYDVHSLTAELQNAGLELHRWKNTELFDPKQVINDNGIHEILDAMNYVNQSHIANLLTEGFLELFAVREHPNTKEVEITENTILRSIPTTTQYQLNDSGEVTEEISINKYKIKGDALYFDAGERRPGVLYYGKPQDCIDETQRIFQIVPFPQISSANGIAILGSLLKIFKNPITLEEGINSIQRTHGPLPTADIQTILNFFLRPPYRLFAIESI